MSLSGSLPLGLAGVPCAHSALSQPLFIYITPVMLHKRQRNAAKCFSAAFISRHEHRRLRLALCSAVTETSRCLQWKQAEMLQASQTVRDNIWTDSTAKNWRNFCSAWIVMKPRLKLSPPCRELGQNRTSTCFCSACTRSHVFMLWVSCQHWNNKYHVRVLKLDVRTFCGIKIYISDEMLEHVQLCLLSQNTICPTKHQDVSQPGLWNQNKYI